MRTTGRTLVQRVASAIVASVLLIGLTTAAAAILLVGLATAADIPRMDKDQLKDLMDKGGVVVLDVRAGKDWTASEFMIAGAERADPEDIDSWSVRYAKDRVMVLYCA